jgi:hypothetical protein
MNPFDRLLADRVRRAFDAYQEEPDAAAFAALTEKLRAQDPKSSFIAGRIFTIGIPLAAAASVMLAVGLTIWRATSVPTPIGVEPQAQVYAETPAVHSTPVAIPAVSQPPAIIQPPDPSPHLIVSVPEPTTEPEGSGEVPPQAGSGIDEAASAAVFRPTNTVRMPDPIREAPTNRRRSGNRRIEWVAGTVSSWSSDQMANGIGYTAGLVGHVAARQGVRVSVGALVNHNRFVIDSDIDLASRIQTLTDEVGVFSATVPGGIEYDPMSIDLPVHVSVDIAQIRSGTFSLTTGMSAMWFIRQTFRDETLLLNATVTTNTDTGVKQTLIRTSSQTQTETIRSLSRSETAGYVHFALGFTARPDRLPVGVDLYAKFPVSDATRRDVVYGMGGITLRYRVR